MAVFLYLYNTLTVPAPDDLALAQKTTVYYADGTTEMGTLGDINRQIMTRRRSRLRLEDDRGLRGSHVLHELGC